MRRPPQELFLLVDVGFLVKESMHLHDGAKAASAETLLTAGQRAGEEAGGAHPQIYRRLQEEPAPPPQRVRVQRHIPGSRCRGILRKKGGETNLLELRVRKLAFLQLSTGGVNVGDRWGERRSLDQREEGDWRMGRGKEKPLIFHTMNFLFVLGNSRLTVL